MKYILFILLLIGCSDSDVKQAKNSNDPFDTVHGKHKNDFTTYGKIANFSEASGICYADKTDSLFIACDDGHLYEIGKDGTVFNTKDFSSMKNHDFEGITYDQSTGLILVAVEGSDNVLVLDQALIFQRKININRTDSLGRLILKKDKENGLEAISVEDGKIFLSNQSFSRLPEEDPSVVFTLDLLEESKSQKDQEAKIGKIFDPGYENISGMHMHNNYLYMVSDTGNLLIKYDTFSQKTVKESKISKFGDEIKHIAVEGLAFDNDGNIYFADDKDGDIFKYRFNE